MKIFFLGFALFLNAAPAFCNPVNLLECSFEHAPILNALVYAYEGKIQALSIPREGDDWIRLEVPDSDWERRIVRLVDSADFNAVVFKRDGEWHFTFKGPGGWYMSGNADCSEQ